MESTFIYIKEELKARDFGLLFFINQPELLEKSHELVVLETTLIQLQNISQTPLMPYQRGFRHTSFSRSVVRDNAKAVRGSRS